MMKTLRWFLALLLALPAALALAASPRSGLEVRLSVPNQVLRGDVDVVVTVTVTNPQRQPVMLPRWQLPSDEVEGALFRVMRDGQAVRYTGPLVKRAPAQAADMVRVDPGVTLSYEVELTQAYQISGNGRYTIEYQSRGTQGSALGVLKSEPLYVWLEGRSEKASASTVTAAAGTRLTGGSAKVVSYSSCSATQQSQLVTADAQALTYSNAAVTYLNGAASGTPRYVKWFGAFSQGNWDTVKSHFVAVQDAFANRNITYDCKCKKTTTYAYVYPTQPYKIYLCGAFWKAPLTGTDSRAGTLIHEMSHFNVVAGTDDWAYGQTNAASLAISDPAKAIDNADSHEYFAENTPFLN